MENGYYRLEHSYYSRGGNKYHGRSSSFHLSAVQNYHANTNKAKHVISINLPDDRYELYAELLSHSNTITRKNSHLSESLLISFDKRMIAAHREEALRAFAHRVTFGGKIKAYAYEHLNDPNNPHAHMQVIDVGPDGTQIGYFGRNATFRREHSPVKGNPTVWFRVAWEQECNNVLERHHYPFRIDHRSNLERGLDAPDKHRGWQKTAALESTPEPLEHKAAKPDPRHMSTLEEYYLAKMSDEERELLSKDYISRDEYHSTAQRITDALEYDLEYQAIQHVKAEIASLEAKAESARQMEAKYREHAREVSRELNLHEQALSVAQEGLAPLVKANGKLRGFELFGFKTKTRRQAIEAQQKVTGHEWSTKVLAADHKDISYRADVSQAEAQMHSTRSQARELQLLHEIRETYGDNKTLKDAEYIHARSVSEALGPVQAHEIYAAFENGELTTEQAIRACELTGDLEMITAIEQRQAIEEEIDPTGAYELDPTDTLGPA